MKAAIFFTVMAGLVFSLGMFISCGDDDDDDSGPTEEPPVDWLQECIDEVKRVADCSHYHSITTDQQIQDTCNQAYASASADACQEAAFEKLVTCLQEVDCSTVDIADEGWNTCFGTYDVAQGACAQ